MTVRFVMERESLKGPPKHSFTITLPEFLVRSYQKIPKSTWRAAMLLFTFGVGIGGGILAVKESIQWYRNRPLPKLPDRKWPEFGFPEFGLRARLSTEWDESSGHLNYRLALMPSDVANSDEFFGRISQHGWLDHVTLNVYDKRHFVVQSSNQYLSNFASVVDSNGKEHSAVCQGQLFLTRDQYAALSSWDLAVNGLPPTSRNATNESTAQKPNGKANSLHGNDVITGYSVVESNLTTSSGLTFHIFKDAETNKAIEWGAESARVNYECNPTLECTLHRSNSGVILHAQLRK